MCFYHKSGKLLRLIKVIIPESDHAIFGFNDPLYAKMIELAIIVDYIGRNGLNS